MNHMEKVSRLRSMLTQVAPHEDLESLHIPMPKGDIAIEAVGMPARQARGLSPAFGAEDAISGIKKLKENRDSEVNPTELLGLEAIVLRENRPVVFVRAGTYDRLGGVWEELDRSAVRSRIDPLLSAIGRIELPNMVSLPYGGTGFLVSPSLLMTNRHVARLFAEGLGSTRLAYQRGDAAVDFKREAFTETDNSSYFTVEDVVMIHPYWDMALVRVAGLSANYEPIMLSVLSPEELVGRNVVVIGYPARDDRNDLALQDQIFQGVYNVKRLQPGKIRPRMRVRSFENDVEAMVHDGSTLGGNSGSAIIDVETGHVIGLHFAGEYLKANYAVPSYELARDTRVVDAGIRFAGKVAVTDLWQPAWIATEAREAAVGRPAANLQAVSAASAATAAVPAAFDGTTLQVPLTLRIGIDVATAPAAAGGTRAAVESAAPGERISMRKLQEMMRDPHVDDAVLAPYFTVNPAASRPFSPAVIPNPALVDVAAPADMQEGLMMMSWANDLSRLRRQEKFKLRIALGDRRPVLVSEGDSWFQFPVLLEDVIDNLHEDYNVWSVDAAGDTLQNMVLDNAEYMQALRRNAGSVRAFLFSGGGNDVIGEDAQGNPVIAQVVKRFEQGRPAVWYLDNPALEQRFRFIEDCYRTVLANVAREFPGLPVLCHGYDYPIPGGGPDDNRHPAWAANDQWIGKAMRERLGINEPALQREIVRLLIDRLNQGLQRVCGGNNQGGAFRDAWHVDVRRVVNGRWADELHPTNDGFAAVGSRFKSLLQRVVRPAQDGAAIQDQERTPNLNDDAEAIRQYHEAGRGDEFVEAVPGWRVGQALLTLRSQINQMAPNRDRRSDGTIGDAAHRTRDSDHNPWVADGNLGIVTAMDITNDPAGGCSADRLASAFQAGRDKRVKYVIWNRRIMSAQSINGAAPWEWRAYSGHNPHDKHLHISILPDKGLYDSTAAWNLAV